MYPIQGNPGPANQFQMQGNPGPTSDILNQHTFVNLPNHLSIEENHFYQMVQGNLPHNILSEVDFVCGDNVVDIINKHHKNSLFIYIKNLIDSDDNSLSEKVKFEVAELLLKAHPELVEYVDAKNGIVDNGIFSINQSRYLYEL